MRDLDDPQLAPSAGPGRTSLGREAQASITLILITLAVVLTISLIGLALT
jgi:hypothetical protein